jgi:hypothetical protein
MKRSVLIRTVSGSGLAVLIGLAAVLSTRAAAQERVNPDAATLQDFQKRIDDYLKLREKADDGAPPLKVTKDPAKIKEAQTALAERIHKARAGAKQGDIFTRAIRAKFRSLMYPELKGPDGAETKKTIKDDAPPAAAIPFKVNAQYPPSQPLPTVPPDILARLPKLPEELEYRIIDKHLILRDVDADLIVDFIPNAIQ